MLKHQSRQRHKLQQNNTVQANPFGLGFSPQVSQDDQSSLLFNFPSDIQSPEQLRHDYNPFKGIRSVSPPVITKNTNHKKNSLVINRDENSSIKRRQDTSAASTDILSKSVLESHIPLLNRKQKQILKKPNRPAVHHKNPFQQQYTNESVSSIYSDEQQQIIERNVKTQKTKKSNTIQSKKKSKSRNISRQKASVTINQQPQKEQSLIQEGIQVLFSQNKIGKTKRSNSPFNSESVIKKQVENTKTRNGQKSQVPLMKQKTVVQDKYNLQSQLRTSSRSKTLKDEPKQNSFQHNLVLLNARKVSKLQSYATNSQIMMSEDFDDDDLYKNQQSDPQFQKQLEEAREQKIMSQIQQSRSLQIIKSFLKHRGKDNKRTYFERWRFQSLAHRSSVQIIAQTRYVNEIMSMRSESENFETIQRKREMILRKGIGCLFRYKSRQLANSFVQWKFTCKFSKYLHNFIQYKQQTQQWQPNENNNNYEIRNYTGKISETVDNDDEENIGDEEFEEKVISQQKKLCLVQNNTVGRKSNTGYNFSNPTAQLDQLPYQYDLFQQILQSPTKDFGRLMKLQSDSSIQYYPDQIVHDISSSRVQRASLFQAVNNLSSPSTIINRQQVSLPSLLLIKMRLEGRLREVFKIWKQETDIYLISIEFKMRQKELQHRQAVKEMIKQVLQVKEKSSIREMQVSFNQWKIITMIDKKAENKKLQMYFANNAKIEIQKSKVVLNKLYQQKQIFDEQQQVFRSRSTSPQTDQFTNRYYQSQNYSPQIPSSFSPTQINSMINFSPMQHHQIDPRIPRFSHPSQMQNHLNQFPQNNIQLPKQKQLHQNNQQILQMMNPYFSKNQHALPQKLQKIVQDKNDQVELVNQIKAVCYDMLLEILDEADKNQRSPNAN